MRWTRALPGWLSLGVLAAIVVGLLAAIGWVKPYLAGPDLAVTTIYRPRPVPVEVERVKWLTRTEVKTERVEVPVVVIREVEPKIEKKLAEEFNLELPKLAAENRALVDVVAVPRAPYGGEMALTVSTEAGTIEGIFRARPAPFLELGGMRELGVDYDPFNRAASGYYRQDLVRIGPAVINGKAFAELPLGGGSASAGASIGVAVRF